MSPSRYYHMCHRAIGRPVVIRCFGGRVHRGVIERVTPKMVYLRPVGRGRNYGGYGLGWGWGWGFGYGVALGTIASLAFIPFFFW